MHLADAERIIEQLDEIAEYMRCRNCGRYLEEHVKGKCLWEPTEYKSSAMWIP